MEASQQVYGLRTYCWLWLLFWVTVAVGIIMAIFESGWAAIFLFAASILALITVFWRCPFCEKRAGFKQYAGGFVLLGLPGARQCVHCSKLLVQRRAF
jgi:hypothetical protein